MHRLSDVSTVNKDRTCKDNDKNNALDVSLTLQNACECPSAKLVSVGATCYNRNILTEKGNHIIPLSPEQHTTYLYPSLSEVSDCDLFQCGFSGSSRHFLKKSLNANFLIASKSNNLVFKELMILGRFHNDIRMSVAAKRKQISDVSVDAGYVTKGDITVSHL